jgi:hypothetical protein
MERRVVGDPDARYWMARERLEALRTEAARERLARAAARAGRHHGRSLRVMLGLALVRAGMALGGDGRMPEAPTTRASSRG